MCRNIKTLHNFEPPATEDEVRASALQFVRKLSGFNHPSKANELAFNRAASRVRIVGRARQQCPATRPRGRSRKAPRPHRRTVWRRVKDGRAQIGQLQFSPLQE